MPKVERIEVPVKPEVKYVITLTEQEAKSVKDYLQSRGTHPVLTPIFFQLP